MKLTTYTASLVFVQGLSVALPLVDNDVINLDNAAQTANDLSNGVSVVTSPSNLQNGGGDSFIPNLQNGGGNPFIPSAQADPSQPNLLNGLLGGGVPNGLDKMLSGSTASNGFPPGSLGPSGGPQLVPGNSLDSSPDMPNDITAGPGTGNGPVGQPGSMSNQPGGPAGGQGGGQGEGAGAVGDDFPLRDKCNMENPGSAGMDLDCQCTKFVEWRLESRYKFPVKQTGPWPDANQWAGRASAQGIPVDGNPTPGCVAQTTKGEFGHVAMVAEVDPSGGQITVEDYNGQGGPGRYGKYTVPVSNFENYIHFEKSQGARG
ncbi:choline binding protein D [Metarhizium album ARSEF 1941]|uniref:Choline binding protein D n=1 Tax=Metarhizium album (strain ARSEF 1941) TaxID=1081103 RepID=A0A0B2WUV0_METAS|nr:choline binding protein D [Metarhizium album ARSEF 1941]KHN97399.1 choline binding protein D [Metarhizium album ARSEF 1941]